MAIVSCDKTIGELLKALGLDGMRTVTVELRIAVDEPVSITVKRFANSDEVSNLRSVIERYDLVARPPVQQSDITAIGDTSRRYTR